MGWSRDLDLDSLVSANCWASLEEKEKVIPYRIDEFNYVVEKCKCFPLHEVPLQSLKGKSGQKISYARMKELEKYTTTSCH